MSCYPFPCAPVIVCDQHSYNDFLSDWFFFVSISEFYEQQKKKRKKIKRRLRVSSLAQKHKRKSVIIRIVFLLPEQEKKSIKLSVRLYCADQREPTCYSSFFSSSKKVILFCPNRLPSGISACHCQLLVWLLSDYKGRVLYQKK